MDRNTAIDILCNVMGRFAFYMFYSLYDTTVLTSNMSTKRLSSAFHTKQHISGLQTNFYDCSTQSVWYNYDGAETIPLYLTCYFLTGSAQDEANQSGMG